MRSPGTLGGVVAAVLVVVLVGVALVAGVAAAPTSDPPGALPSAPLAAPLSSVAAAPRAPSVRRSPGPPPHVVLALGDSVPSGAACSCSPFPELYGKLLQRRTGAEVSVRNDAVDGLDTGGLLSQLAQPQVAATGRRADVFLVTIGANDFGDHHDQVVGGTCTTAAGPDCVSDEIDSMRANLARLLSEIRGLRGGRPTAVLVTGYWNVFEDGEVARRTFGDAGLRASLRLTRRVNATIRAVATGAGAHYVDLFGPFERQGRDVDSLMAADGDHPDAAGHRLIARTLVDAGLPRLR